MSAIEPIMPAVDRLNALAHEIERLWGGYLPLSVRYEAAKAADAIALAYAQRVGVEDMPEPADRGAVGIVPEPSWVEPYHQGAADAERVLVGLLRARAESYGRDAVKLRDTGGAQGPDAFHLGSARAFDIVRDELRKIAKEYSAPEKP